MKSRVRLAVLRLVGGLLHGAAAPPHPVPQAPSILVLRPDHLGDVLLSRPALDALAASLPDAQITVAVGPWGRPALGRAPRERLLICPFPGFSRTASGMFRPYMLLLRYALLIRRRHFDMAVVLRPDHWWGALLAALAGIPVRVGYSSPETAPFLTAALSLQPGSHAVLQALALAGAAIDATGTAHAPLNLQEMRLPASATEADRAKAAQVLLDAGIAAEERLLVVHPGAGAALKAWQPDRFAHLGAVLSGELGARVVVTGSPAEHELAEQICANLPGAVNLSGALDWSALEALLARAELVLGVDSGPLHLAVAAGTASVALFGPADPAQFGPWGPTDQHRIVTADLPCRPCRRLDLCRIAPGRPGPPPCMRAITADSVIAAARLAVASERTHDAPTE